MAFTFMVSGIAHSVVANPDTIAAQVERGAFGLMAAKCGAIALKGGHVEPGNFHDCRPMRMNEVPVLETRIIKSTKASRGFGEPSYTCVTLAVTYATLAVTGKRIRTLPTRPIPASCNLSEFLEERTQVLRAERAYGHVAGRVRDLMSANAPVPAAPLKAVSAFSTISGKARHWV
jgi:hypothetical protein